MLHNELCHPAVTGWHLIDGCSRHRPPSSLTAPWRSLCVRPKHAHFRRVRLGRVQFRRERPHHGHLRGSGTSMFISDGAGLGTLIQMGRSVRTEYNTSDPVHLTVRFNSSFDSQIAYSERLSGYQTTTVSAQTRPLV